MAKLIEGLTDGQVDVGKTRVKWDLRFVVQIDRRPPKRIWGKPWLRAKED